MLDIKLIRDNADAVQQAADAKKIRLSVRDVLEADERRIALLREVEALLAQKNNLNERIAQASADERAAVITQGKEIKAKIEALQPKLREAEEAFHALMVLVPTVPAADVPRGADERDNVVVYEKGEKPQFAFTPQDHIALGTALGIVDFERGAKVAGYRGYYLKGDGAALTMALMMYALHKMIGKGFAPMIPPTLVKEFALFGSGYFKGATYDPQVDEIYQVAHRGKEQDGAETKEKKFLVGTAEPSLLAYHANEMLDVQQLPLKLCGFSQCYRSEIGSYGKDTKGMYRVHEFMKIEQVVLAPADVDATEHLQQEMVAAIVRS